METVYFACKTADKSGNGVLEKSVFFSALHSKTVNLNLTIEEQDELLRIKNMQRNGSVRYVDVIPVLKQGLQRVYQRKKTQEESWNDWCMLKTAAGMCLYLNKKSGTLQSTRPTSFNEGRVEEQKFEYFMLFDGTEICTYINEHGQRLYMNWDTQEWLPIPQEWYQAQAEKRTELDENDPRMGQLKHPTRGLIPTYFFENPRNTRLYFEESEGQWARMPLAWERNLPEVQQQLQELDAAFPLWKNVNEQLLTLRECNYDLPDAMVFAEINWSFKPAPLPSQKQGRRPGTAAQGRRVGEQDDGGVLSVAAAARINALETELVACRAENEELRRSAKEEQSEQMQTLTREKTKVETSLVRKERVAQDAQAKIGELSRLVLEYRAQLAECENELLGCKADRDKLVALEKQLTALEQDGQSAVPSLALKAKSSESDTLRMENVALKMKIHSIRRRLEFPMANPETALLIKNLHGQVVILREDKDRVLRDTESSLNAMTAMAIQAAKMSQGLAASVRQQVEDITVKYRAEVLQRKLLYNKVQELRGNIRVFCRVRQDERLEKDNNIFEYPSSSEVLVVSQHGEKQLMDFDHVYGPSATQENVFDDTRPIIMSCVDGYNVCIMAYGQTGSGKTFTMMGPSSNMGVNRRAVRELFALCSKTSEIQYTIQVSLMEVYNEKIYDLLTGQRGSSLEVHQAASGSTYVAGLTEELVSVAEDIESIFRRGDAHRSVAATACNSDSSRSHSIMQISVKAYNKISKVTSLGKLMLVDLAGSERVAKSEVAGLRLVEAAAINKSLSALGQVFKALATNAPHVPYRNSKLTHILQDSLGGDAKTAVFVNCSPLAANISETHCTLSFGRNIRKIELGPQKPRAARLPGGAPGPPAPRLR